MCAAAIKPPVRDTTDPKVHTVLPEILTDKSCNLIGAMSLNK